MRIHQQHTQLQRTDAYYADNPDAGVAEVTLVGGCFLRVKRED